MPPNYRGLVSSFKGAIGIHVEFTGFSRSPPNCHGSAGDDDDGGFVFFEGVGSGEWGVGVGSGEWGVGSGAKGERGKGKGGIFVGFLAEFVEFVDGKTENSLQLLQRLTSKSNSKD
jgi:hypothetical protein